MSFLTRFAETVAAAKEFERQDAARRKGLTAPQARAQTQPSRPPVPPSELARRRDRLAAQLSELQTDLGGLTYEMAIRDHFRMDTLVRQAARMQELDAELANVERLLQLEQAGAAGRCPSCRSLYARGAVFCGQCGTRLMDEVSLDQATTRVLGPTR